MSDFIEKLANNNYVIIGLAVLLGVLIILFFVLLISGKGKKNKEDDTPIEINKEESIVPNNIDFDHGEYVKETTAEFELTPITEVKPTPDEFMPDVNVEESPAINVNNKSLEDVPLADFNFDDLSKSISEELDRLKIEEENQTTEVPTINSNPVVSETAPSSPTDNSIPQVTFVDAFKEVDNKVPVETLNVSNTAANNNVVLPNNSAEEPSFITDFSNFQPNTANKPATNEPVIKETETPLFARFNQETYEINKKD